MVIGEEMVGELVRRVLSVASPERIILFGSAASGRTSRDSDIDLLVVEKDPGNLLEKTVRLHHALRGVGHPVDVVVMTAERFAESKEVIGGIAYAAWRYGRPIYEAA
jgi:predicted nucleotidyltransferase